MKRIAIFLLILSVLTTLFSVGCNESDTPTETTPTDTQAGTVADTQTELPTEAATEAPTAESATDAQTAQETETEKVLEKTEPKIILSSTQDITVNAGETIQLPTYTCTDYDGRDLTSWVEMQDNIEPGSFGAGAFTGHIAGDHTLYYSVETSDGRLGEAFLTVHVNAAHANTFDVQGSDNCENMVNYKIFRDGFEKGVKSPLYSALGDGGNVTNLTADESAIEGNSLIVDFEKAAGATETSVFLLGFNEYFHRNEQTTYKVTFSFKVLEKNGNTNDIYFGLSWDGSTGINRQFIPADAEVGKVYTFTTEFQSVLVPEGGNAYFFFFKLNRTDSPITVALDNFIVETVKVNQVKTVIPSADEVAAGFKWDFTQNGAVCSNGQTVAVNTLSADIQSAMAASGVFSANALKLTGADDHNFSGLTEKNLTPGKKLVIDMDYYAVNGNNFYLIMMGRAGNPTQSVTKTEHDGIVSVHLETTVQDGWYQLNIYGQNNPQFEIYIAHISVTVK